MHGGVRPARSGRGPKREGQLGGGLVCAASCPRSSGASDDSLGGRRPSHRLTHPRQGMRSGQRDSMCRVGLTVAGGLRRAPISRGLRSLKTPVATGRKRRTCPLEEATALRSYDGAPRLPNASVLASGLQRRSRSAPGCGARRIQGKCDSDSPDPVWLHSSIRPRYPGLRRCRSMPSANGARFSTRSLCRGERHRRV